MLNERILQEVLLIFIGAMLSACDGEDANSVVVSTPISTEDNVFEFQKSQGVSSKFKNINIDSESGIEVFRKKPDYTNNYFAESDSIFSPPIDQYPYLVFFYLSSTTATQFIYMLNRAIALAHNYPIAVEKKEIRTPPIKEGVRLSDILNITPVKNEIEGQEISHYIINTNYQPFLLSLGDVFPIIGAHNKQIHDAIFYQEKDIAKYLLVIENAIYEGSFYKKNKDVMLKINLVYANVSNINDLRFIYSKEQERKLMAVIFRSEKELIFLNFKFLDVRHIVGLDVLKQYYFVFVEDNTENFGNLFAYWLNPKTNEEECCVAHLNEDKKSINFERCIDKKQETKYTQQSIGSNENEFMNDVGHEPHDDFSNSDALLPGGHSLVVPSLLLGVGFVGGYSAARISTAGGLFAVYELIRNILFVTYGSPSSTDGINNFMAVRADDYHSMIELGNSINMDTLIATAETLIVDNTNINIIAFTVTEQNVAEVRQNITDEINRVAAGQIVFMPVFYAGHYILFVVENRDGSNHVLYLDSNNTESGIRNNSIFYQTLDQVSDSLTILAAEMQAANDCGYYVLLMIDLIMNRGFDGAVQYFRDHTMQQDTTYDYFSLRLRRHYANLAFPNDAVPAGLDGDLFAPELDWFQRQVRSRGSSVYNATDNLYGESLLQVVPSFVLNEENENYLFPEFDKSKTNSASAFSDNQLNLQTEREIRMLLSLDNLHRRATAYISAINEGSLVVEYQLQLDELNMNRYRIEEASTREETRQQNIERISQEIAFQEQEIKRLREENFKIEKDIDKEKVKKRARQLEVQQLKQNISILQCRKEKKQAQNKGTMKRCMEIREEQQQSKSVRQKERQQMVSKLQVREDLIKSKIAELQKQLSLEGDQNATFEEALSMIEKQLVEGFTAEQEEKLFSVLIELKNKLEEIKKLVADYQKQRDGFLGRGAKSVDSSNIDESDDDIVQTAIAEEQDIEAIDSRIMWYEQQLQEYAQETQDSKNKKESLLKKAQSNEKLLVKNINLRDEKQKIHADIASYDSEFGNQQNLQYMENRMQFLNKQIAKIKDVQERKKSFYQKISDLHKKFEDNISNVLVMKSFPILYEYHSLLSEEEIAETEWIILQLEEEMQKVEL